MLSPSFAPTALFLCIIVLFSGINKENSFQSISPKTPTTVTDQQTDTLVNYCTLIRAAYFYGQKSTESTPLSDVDVKYFNDNWKQVFDIPFYQTGITSAEFSSTQRFKEGNRIPFPPSVLYNDKNPDTYLLFHLAKEIGKIKSKAYEQCPACVAESLNKINTLLKGTRLQYQVAQIWLGTSTMKTLTSVQEITDFWLFLRCLTIDDRVNPKSQPVLVSLSPVVKCPDTTFIKCKDEMKPKVRVGYRHCEIGGKVDTIGPMRVKGIDNCPGTIYRYKFVARDQCLKKDSAYQYFVIKNDGPELTCPRDTILDCIGHLVIPKIRTTASCSVRTKIITRGPWLVTGKHNCPDAEYKMEYTVRDTCGRDEKCIQQITIQNNPPKIECPPDAIVECSKDIKPGNVKYTISCCKKADVETSGPKLVKGKPDCDGSVYELIYTVEDSCGRTASCTQNFTIRNKGPEIICPPNEEVLCFDDIKISAPSEVKVACDLKYTVKRSDPLLVIGKKNCVGSVYQVIFTVTDECGRTDECQQIFTILKEDINIECPPDLTVMCSKDIKPSTAVVKVPCKLDFKVTPSATKFVSGKKDCPGAKYQIVYHVEDACGRTKDCVQTFTIANPDPEIVCYPDLTIECDKDPELVLPVPVVSCGLHYDLDVTDPVHISGKENCDGSVYKITYTVTDECGRTAQCTQRFTLHIPPPEIKCGPEVIIECDVPPNYVAPVPVVSCSLKYELQTSDPFHISGPEDCDGSVYGIRYTVTDECGQTAECVQRFRAHIPLPVIQCPPDQVVECEEDIITGNPIVNTSCDQQYTLSHQGPKLVKGIKNCPGAEYTIIYTVTDDCNRIVSCTQRFKIANSGPDIKCPPDRIVQCVKDIKDEHPDAGSACGEGNLYVEGPKLESGKANCPNAVYTLTYKAEDGCGRKDICIQRFRLSGDDLQVDCPHDTTVQSKADIRPSAIYAHTSCDVGAHVTNGQPRLVSGKDNQPGSVYEITYIIVDDCDQRETCVQRFTTMSCSAFYPNTEPVWNAQKKLFECNCIKGYVWNATKTGCELPQIPDCNAYYPNSQAVFNAQTNKYECNCITGYVWNATRTACELQVPDCNAYYPNTQAVLNPQTNKYECNCITGYVWNATRTGCELQVPDCKAYYPNSVAVWNANTKQYECNCITGYVWNAGRTACVPSVPDCNSYYPNTVAAWNAQKNQYECNCIQGYVWNAGRTACVSSVPDCNAYYPNTTAVWNAQKNQYECNCNQGYVWNATRTACELAAPDCNKIYPNTIARFNYSTNQYECICLLGYTWNSTKTGCILATPDCNSYFPNTAAVWDAATNQYLCNCIQGYEWNATRTGCVASPNRDNPPVNPAQQKTGECNISYGSGANEPEQYTIDVHSVTGTLTFTYNTYQIKDRIHVYYGNGKIFDTGCVGTSGSQNFTLDGYNSVFRIIVDPLCDPTESDTQWDFTLGCPH